MSDSVDPGHGAESAVSSGPPESVEAYETDDAVVLYDAENPLAWIESTETVRIDDLV